MLERVKRAQIQYDGVIDELKRLNGQRGMASAVDTGVAAVVIVVLFERGTRTLVKRRDFSMRAPVVCRFHLVLHGMGASMHAIECDGQHDHEDKSGKEFYGD